MEWVKVFSSEAEARSRLSSGKPQLLIVRGVRICLVANTAGFHAVQDECTHNRESLSKGTVNSAGQIVCPWHNYRFDLATGHACDSGCRDLRLYPVKADEAGFFIGL